MVQATGSGCINHPAIEAVARCKQCGTPVCGQCVVDGPAGKYCSPVCKEKHETFLRRAAAQDTTRKAKGDGARAVRKLIIKLIILAVVVAAAAIACVALDIPVAGDALRPFVGKLGIPLN